MVAKKIRVLVVDDSAFMRKALKRMLNSDPIIKVVGEAKNGLEAISEVQRLNPDVVTLDLKMPLMDGLMVLDKIMTENPTPVLMVSSLTSEGGELTLKALAKGAIDFIDKSSCHTHMDILEIADSLIQKVKVLAGVDLHKLMFKDVFPAAPESVPEMKPLPADIFPEKPRHLVLIGASTGGPMALEKVLTALPADYPGAILVVQHMPMGFTKSLSERLNNASALEIKEAKDDDIITARTVYIAPGGYHMKIKKNMAKYHIVLSKSPRDAAHIPSIDVMMQSVAETWEGRILAVIMTGMGQDGALGVKAISDKGGTIIAQDESTCVVFGMPKAALQTGAVFRVVPLGDISQEIIDFVSGPAYKVSESQN